MHHILGVEQLPRVRFSQALTD